MSKIFRQKRLIQLVALKCASVANWLLSKRELTISLIKYIKGAIKANNDQIHQRLRTYPKIIQFKQKKYKKKKKKKFK